MVGETVHYVSHGSPVRADGTQEYTSQCRAAIVTDVTDPSGVLAELCVLNPEGIFFKRVRHDNAEGPGTWHYMGHS